MEPTCDGCGYGWTDCKCDNEVEHKSDLNLDRLKAVSELLWAVVSDLQAKKYDANEYLSTSDGGYEITVGDIFTFADQLLQLADENEKQRQKFHDWFTHMMSNATVSGQPYAKVTVALIDDVLEQLSPVSPKKPDDEK